MKTVTKPVYGPDQLKYSAEYKEAENASELEQVIKDMGLTMKDVNVALRQAKKRYYNAALEATPASKIEALVASAKATGAFSQEELDTMVESIRNKVTNSLPTGLTPVKDEKGEHIRGALRGRAAANAKAEAAA